MQKAVAIKDEMHRLADQLSDQATWDDVAREVTFRQSVQKGIADADAGRVISHADMKSKWEKKLAAKVDS